MQRQEGNLSSGFYGNLSSRTSPRFLFSSFLVVSEAPLEGELRSAVVCPLLAARFDQGGIQLYNCSRVRLKANTWYE